MAGYLIRTGIFVAGLGLLACGARAQTTEPANLPSAEGLATALSDPLKRHDTLLTIAAIARLRHKLPSASPEDPPERVRDILNDRAWLEGLALRYGPAYPRSPVLDPAAWRVHLELDKHQLQAKRLVSPVGPGIEVYLDQVFNRVNGRLAAAVLPELLWLLETRATIIWQDLLRQVQADEALAQALAGAQGDLFKDWAGDDLPSPASDPGELIAETTASLGVLVSSAIGSGPPDAARLQSIRYSLLVAIPGLEGGNLQSADSLLHVASLVDGLNEHRYFSFAEGLLSVMAGLVFLAPEQRQEVAVLSAWLVEILPGISSTYARAFAGVDPRINTAIAAAFDVAREFSRVVEDHPDSGRLRQQLADAVAQLALLIPDLAFYFDLPVRDPIAGGVDACTGIVAASDPDGTPAMTRRLFDDCQESLVALANEEAREAQLSGDPDGPFGETQLQRELSVTSGQRINYGIGYLHDRYSIGCEAPRQPLPNPLEWSYLASLMSWFADQSPVYFQTPENEQRLMRMREIGLELMRVVGEQVDCIAGAGASVDDPVSRILGDYRDALGALTKGLINADLEFRQYYLAPGADVALEGDARQATAYRPDDLVIGPCDSERVCEMSGHLSSTRALLGLFPDEYLIADQTGQGKVEICYDRMEWVERHSEPVRAGDENVANYSGHLAFDLRGRYLAQGSVTGIFAFRFTSPEEHHYLFGAATKEVLEDSCPVEWIGVQIVTTLPNNGRGIVPNRLTYLSAPRMLPSRLLARNWDRGAEWRDWFVTGIGVRSLQEDPPPDISARVTQHIEALYRLEQESIYGSILQSASRDSTKAFTSLFDDMTTLTTLKSLIRMQMVLYYPRILIESDQLRSAMTGQNGLLDAQVLIRFREDNVPVAAINDIAFERLDRFQAKWRLQPEAVRRNGTVAVTLAHALMRLNALYAKYFALPSAPDEELQVSPGPVEGAGG